MDEAASMDFSTLLIPASADPKRIRSCYDLYYVDLLPPCEHFPLSVCEGPKRSDGAMIKLSLVTGMGHLKCVLPGQVVTVYSRFNSGLLM